MLATFTFVVLGGWVNAEKFWSLILSVIVVVIIGKKLWYSYRTIPKKNKEIRSHLPEIESRKDVIRAEINQLQPNLALLNNTYQALGGIELYPSNYLYPEALQQAISLISSHRASSVGEAINMYESMLAYKAQVAREEAFRRQQLDLQRRQAEAQEQTAQSTVRQEVDQNQFYKLWEERTRGR